jgi:hypothetical protein
VTSVACLALFLLVGLSAHAQQHRYRPPPDYGHFGKPNQEEGKKFLDEVRQRGIPGQYYAEFELILQPRRGGAAAERTVQAQLWSGTNSRGPISRLVLYPGVKASERRLLIQYGPQSAVWSWQPSDGKNVKPLGLAALFEPLAGTHFTPFDLQMQYLYWNDFLYEGTIKLRGRPTNVFLLYPPDDVAAQYPDLTGVRVYLDTQGYFMSQAEMIGPEGKILKSVELGGFQIFGGQPFPKTVDYRDELTRNKTRFSLVRVGFRLNFSMTVFEPANLAEPISPPSGKMYP